MLGLARLVLRGGGCAPTAPTAGGLLVLGCKLQVRDGFHQLGLGLFQKAVNVFSAVLGQGCPLLLPVSFGCLEIGQAGIPVMLIGLKSRAWQSITGFQK